MEVKIDISGALKKIDDLARDQAPFAAALALTRTAQAVKADLRAAMQSAFEHPRRYTLGSLAIKRATKQALRAEVYVRSPSVARALSVEITGGRRDKAIEKFLGDVIPAGMFAVPGSEARLGADGKVSIAWLQQLRSALGITGNVSASTKRRRRMPTSANVFVLPEPHGRLKPGIYQRSARQVLPLIIFTRQPSYRAKFDFYGIGERSVREHFPEEFRKAAEEAMRTAR